MGTQGPKETVIHADVLDTIVFVALISTFPTESNASIFAAVPNLLAVLALATVSV